MGAVSVAQAAERLGVSVPRIHQRIADGSLSAERIGFQWVVDERPGSANGSQGRRLVRSPHWPSYFGVTSVLRHPGPSPPLPGRPQHPTEAAAAAGSRRGAA